MVQAEERQWRGDGIAGSQRVCRWHDSPRPQGLTQESPQCYRPNPGHALPLFTYCSPGIWPISCLRTRSSLPGNWGTL